MIIDNNLLLEIFLYVAFIGSCSYVLYRRYIYSIIDPLFWHIFNTTFGSVLVLEVLDDPRRVIHYFICQLCLFAGFAFVQERTGNPSIASSLENNSNFKDIDTLRCTVYALLAIYVFANLFLLSTKGFALLSDSPTDAKVANFRQGFGIIRKINWAMGGIAATGFTFLYLIRRRNRDLLCLALIMALTALDGSKGALVKFVICFGLFTQHPFFRGVYILPKSIKWLAPLVVIGLFGTVATVLLKENTDTDAALFAFLRRLLYNADGVLYYYQPENLQYFAKYDATDFLPHILNPILGFFRITPYQEAFGNVMVDNVLPRGLVMDVIVGPNSTFYLEGQIFFGYFGAFIYSFILGCIYSRMRSFYFSLTSSSAFFLIMINQIYQFAGALFGDVVLYVTQVFDTCFLCIPIYLLVCFALKGKVIFRRIRFSKRHSQLFASYEKN